jgi:hypothetical protein
VAELPAGALKRGLPGGVLVTVVGSPPEAGQTFRELFVQFNEAGEVAGVRARYAGTAAKAGVARKLLASLETRAGVPEENSRGAGSPSYRWRDDLTSVVWARDGSGVDVTLRDRLPGQDGDTPRSMTYLPRGPEGCLLATTGDELRRAWGVRGPAAVGQPLVLTPKEGGPYDALLVWLEGDRVARVVALHKEPEQADMSPAQAGTAVTEAWGREAALLGWPRLQDVAAGAAVRSWANYDDRTRVRIFWQQNAGEAPRVYTEWRDQGRP